MHEGNENYFDTAILKSLDNLSTLFMDTTSREDTAMTSPLNL